MKSIGRLLIIFNVVASGLLTDRKAQHNLGPPFVSPSSPSSRSLRQTLHRAVLIMLGYCIKVLCLSTEGSHISETGLILAKARCNMCEHLCQQIAIMVSH